MNHLTPSKELFTGLLFVSIGAVTLFMARGFSFGTPMRMGAGFFPVILSSLILILGAIVFIRALLAPHSTERVEGLALRPLILISASVVIFALAVRPLGLIPAIIVATVVSRFAIKGGSILEYVGLSAVLIVSCVAVFVYGLGMPFRLGFGL